MCDPFVLMRLCLQLLETFLGSFTVKVQRMHTWSCNRCVSVQDVVNMLSFQADNADLAEMGAASGAPAVPDLKGAGAVQHDADAVDFSDISDDEEHGAAAETAEQAPAQLPAPGAPAASLPTGEPGQPSAGPGETIAPVEAAPAASAVPAAPVSGPGPAANSAALPAADVVADPSALPLMPLEEYLQLADEDAVRKPDPDEAARPPLLTVGAIAITCDIFADAIMRETYGVGVADDMKGKTVIDVVSFSDTLVLPGDFDQPQICQKAPVERRALVRGS
jgi:hypothetical protein